MKMAIKTPLATLMAMLMTMLMTGALLGSGALHAESTNETNEGDAPMVVFETNHGSFTLEMLPDDAPVTVENFLQYVDDGFFDGTIFHRVIPGFMIQGGGFTKDMEQKQTRAPIKNEADNGLKNSRGYLSMARTQAVDSATSQFFINVTDNAFLDHGSRDFGYAVFARVAEGMDVIDKIVAVPTGNQGMHQNVPQDPVMVEKASRK